jgi:hypothetical protein
MFQQIIIGFGDLLEFPFGPGRTVPVGMVFQSQLPVDSFNLLAGSSRGQSQYFMVILRRQGLLLTQVIQSPLTIKKAVRREDGQLTPINPKTKPNLPATA